MYTETICMLSYSISDIEVVEVRDVLSSTGETSNR